MSEQTRVSLRERDELLDALLPGLRVGCRGSKLQLGDLSPGCRVCVAGGWSCLFVNLVCHQNCFFCPGGMTAENETFAENIYFSDPLEYLDYVERFGVSGVGFSGGEPLLTFDRLLVLLEGLRRRFGPGLHLWLYTSGEPVTPPKLRRLRAAGLDEIRFNISARSYRLDRVATAVGLINTVTVEIPAIPEEQKLVEQSLGALREIGVDFLNLHQLMCTGNNSKALARRNYTVLREPNMPVLESELAALRILRTAVEMDLGLPIQYCSAVFKKRFQGPSEARRTLRLVREDFEGETPSGHLRRLQVEGSRSWIEKIDAGLRNAGFGEALWRVDGSGTRLTFHHSLIEPVAAGNLPVHLSYFAPSMRPDPDSDGAADRRCVVLGGGREIPVWMLPVAREYVLSGEAARRFSRIYLDHDVPEGNRGPRFPADPSRTGRAGQASADIAGIQHELASFEFVETGLGVETRSVVLTPERVGAILDKEVNPEETKVQREEPP